jgi:hypothetical protein
MAGNRRDGRLAETTDQGANAMWWYFGGFFAFLYLVLIITLGVSTLRKGHWVMFIVGIFFPLFWIIGALMPPTRQSAQLA